MELMIEIEKENDGSWLAEVLGIPGVLAYGLTELEAVRNVATLALRVLIERHAYGDNPPI
jgi:predicted RNase H-like HicB family nuclease